MTEEGAPELHKRGWRYEETVWTRDTAGNPMPVTTGVTTDNRGELVAVIANGTGPTCIIPIERDGDMNTAVSLNVINAVAALHDLKKQQRGTP